MGQVSGPCQFTTKFTKASGPEGLWPGGKTKLTKSTKNDHGEDDDLICVEKTRRTATAKATT